LLPDRREHSGSDPNDLNGTHIAAMFVVSALDKFRLDPVEMGQIRQEVYPEQSGSKSDRNQGKDGETTVP
jgi:hypothetical protein